MTLEKSKASIVQTALVPSRVPVPRPRRPLRRLFFGMLGIVSTITLVLGTYAGGPLFALWLLPALYFFIEAWKAGGWVELVESKVQVNVGPSLVVFDFPGVFRDRRGHALALRWSFKPENLDRATSRIDRHGTVKISASNMVREVVGSDGNTNDAICVGQANFEFRPMSEEARRNLLDVLPIPSSV